MKKLLSNPGGFISCDRNEALKENWETIKKITEPFQTTLQEVISMDKHLEIIDALTRKLVAVKKKNSRRKMALKQLQKAYELREIDHNQEIQELNEEHCEQIDILYENMRILQTQLDKESQKETIFSWWRR